MSSDHLIQGLAVLAASFIVSLMVWLVVQMFAVKRWQAAKDASEKPDTDLRNDLPLIKDVITRHGAELQTMRESMLLVQKEITVKLEGISESLESLQTNCLMHKMITAGKTDVLANFIRKEISADESGTR